MSYSYPNPPHSDSNPGSVCNIDDLFDSVTFDGAIREVPTRILPERSEVSDRASSSNLDQATHDISCNTAESRMHVVDRTPSQAAIANSVHQVNLPEQVMAERLEEFLEHNRFVRLPVSQDARPLDITEIDSINRGHRLQFTHQGVKHSRLRSSNVKSSTGVKRLRSGMRPAKTPYKHLRPRDQQFQAPDHVHEPPLRPTRTNGSYAFPLPTNDEISNAGFDHRGAAHQADLRVIMSKGNGDDESQVQRSLQADVSEFNAFSMPDTRNDLVLDNEQETFPIGVSSSFYESIAHPILIANSADMSSDILPPYSAPTIAYQPSQEPIDNAPAECMSCNALTPTTGDLACFRVVAAVLPLCGHFVCHCCITKHYDLKGEYNSCIYCPICDSFSGCLSISDVSLPTLSRDLHYLIYKARRLPPACFATQALSINVDEASVVLKGVFKIVAAELGSDAMYTTASLPMHRFYTSLDNSLQARKNNDVTSPEELKAVLIECIETRAVDELGRWYGRLWLRSQFGYRRQTYRWHKLKAALERHWVHNTEIQVMQAWASIVNGVVQVLTLRWEHRLDAMLGSVDFGVSNGQTLRLEAS